MFHARVKEKEDNLRFRVDQTGEIIHRAAHQH
jgi:hypothetical protein